MPLVRAKSARSIPWPLALALGAAVVGVGLRVYTLTSHLRILDADEPVWGLMARHVLDGEFYVFFWDQAYGGTQEAVLTAGVFALTGSSTLTLRIVPTALAGLAAILVWRIGRRTVGEPAATVAGALFWIYPPYTVWKLTRAHGFYASGLVCALLVLLVALRLRERPTYTDAAAIGLALGYAWWATPSSALVCAPALGWLVWQRPRVLRLAWVTIPAAALGSLPWLAWNATNGWQSLDLPKPFREESFVERFIGFFSTTFPSLLGLRVPFSLEWTIGAWLGWTLVAAALAGFIWIVIRRFGGPETPLLLIALAYPILLSLTPISSYRAEPRYLVLLAPIVVLLLAQFLARRPTVAALGLAAALALTTVGLARHNSDRIIRATSGGKTVPFDLHPLIDALEQEGVDRVLADYEFAYGITFLSRERVIATSPQHVRYKPHDELVRQSQSAAHVFVPGSRLELAERDVLGKEGYRRFERGGFAIYLRR